MATLLSISTTTCKHCQQTISGIGRNNAVLCIKCWAHIIIRVEQGEQQKDLAAEFGVSNQAVSSKVATYGSQD